MNLLYRLCMIAGYARQALSAAPPLADDAMLRPTETRELHAPAFTPVPLSPNAPAGFPPYGLYTAIARAQGVTPSHVRRVWLGEVRSERVAAALTEALRSQAGRKADPPTIKREVDSTLVGTKLLAIRTQRKLTQAEFAQSLGVTGPYLSKVEAGKARVSRLFLLAVARQASDESAWWEEAALTLPGRRQGPTA